MKVKSITVSHQPTKEEIDLVSKLASGISGAKIGEENNLPQHELARILANIRTKYNCKNSTELVAYFLRNKLIS